MCKSVNPSENSIILSNIFIFLKVVWFGGKFLGKYCLSTDKNHFTLAFSNSKKPEAVELL